MTTEAQPSAMRRKAGAGRPPPEIGRVTAANVVRASVAQAAQDVAGLAVVAGKVGESRTTLSAFVGDVPDPVLLALVEGPGGRFGLTVLDAQVVAALIEIQTTGRVVARPAEARAPTRTDAIMCADFIDRLLELVDIRVSDAGLDLAPALAGFRYAIPLAEPRAIAMTLEDVPYRLFDFDLDLGRGAKSGRVQILLPFDLPGKGPRDGEDAAAFTEAMRAQVMEAEAHLSATLLRRPMALSEIAALEVGSILAIPRGALGQVDLEALDGTVVARGRLGQVNGHRAVRLTLGTEERAGGPEALASLVELPVGARQAAPGPPQITAGPQQPPAAGDLGTAIPEAGPTDPSGSGDRADLGGLGDIGDLSDIGDLGGLPDIGDLDGLGDLGSLGDPG